MRALENRTAKRGAGWTGWKGGSGWVGALSDTVNGNLSGREKVALETYVQMTFFDRILRRANLRLMVMTGNSNGCVRRRYPGSNT